jgi:hypothetical protein
VKIELSQADDRDRLAHRARLEALLAQSGPRQERPCPGCDVPCACSGSPSCTCGCALSCGHAPKQLSSDPERHPIEDRITPLVYALYSLKVCEPCWSCEGHYDASGMLNRVPAVWFYADAAAYPALIADSLTDLKVKNTLTYPWQVSLVSWGNRLDITYAVEPDLRRVSEPQLDELQADVAAISEHLFDNVRKAAQQSIAEIDRSLGAKPVPARPPATPASRTPVVLAVIERLRAPAATSR